MYLDGISMGAATVLMASEFDLPASVRGIIADCGYTSPRDILKKVIRQCHLPVAPVYFQMCIRDRCNPSKIVVLSNIPRKRQNSFGKGLFKSGVFC